MPDASRNPLVCMAAIILLHCSIRVRLPNPAILMQKGRRNLGGLENIGNF
jgi:hypothetical protein